MTGAFLAAYSLAVCGAPAVLEEALADDELVLPGFWLADPLPLVPAVAEPPVPEVPAGDAPPPELRVIVELLPASRCASCSASRWPSTIAWMYWRSNSA